MKSVLIIGLGRFGHHLCIDMANRGNEVMVIDKDEKKTPDLLEYATAVRVGDCTNEEVLRSLGVGNFDLCFVCIGSNFQSSLEITSLVKELGAKHVVSKELAGEIQEQSVWLMRLMENILNMTKLESEEFEIRKNQEVVDDLIYEAVSHIIGLREKRRFEIKLPSELIVVNVDGKLMVQVLVNLLDNAMKHTGENGWICIEARYDAGKVWISVEDDGDGIQEDLKENIFDEFVTRSDEKGDRQRGIGLGLAICKAVVNAHGGNICAENRKEGGARFMFWLEARQVSTDGR